jgi:nucleoside-diphosphate-sugar epimerase
MKQKKILVTGSDGFLGKAVCSALGNKNYSVVSYDLVAGQNILYTEQLKEALYEIDGVIHLAAPCTPSMFYQDLTSAWNNAVVGMSNLLALYQGRIVFPSTCTLYGDFQFPVKENFKLPLPPNYYAASKVECERLCFLNNIKGGDCKVARIFTGYGAEEQKCEYASPVFKFIQSISKGEQLFIYGDGKQVRDFIFVDDIANALVSILETKSTEVIFNIGTGNGTSFLEILELLKQEMGSVFQPVFQSSPKGYVSSIVADISLARRELGFNPTVSIQEGIRKIIR